MAYLHACMNTCPLTHCAESLSMIDDLDSRQLEWTGATYLPKVGATSTLSKVRKVCWSDIYSFVRWSTLVTFLASFSFVHTVVFLPSVGIAILLPSLVSTSWRDRSALQVTTLMRIGQKR